MTIFIVLTWGFMEQARKIHLQPSISPCCLSRSRSRSVVLGHLVVMLGYLLHLLAAAPHFDWGLHVWLNHLLNYLCRFRLRVLHSALFKLIQKKMFRPTVLWKVHGRKLLCWKASYMVTLKEHCYVTVGFTRTKRNLKANMFHLFLWCKRR